MPTMTGGQAVIRTLSRFGVDTAIGLPGILNATAALLQQAFQSMLSGRSHPAIRWRPACSPDRRCGPRSIWPSSPSS